MVGWTRAWRDSAALAAVSAALLFGASALSGCTIKGDDPLFAVQDSGAASDAAGDGQVACEIPYPAEVDAIFQASCGGGFCHLAGQAASGLSLESANAVSNLVGVASLGSADPRVAPGNADGSYLITKVTGPNPSMPLGGTPLTDEQVNTLRDWVASVPDCSSVTPDGDVVDGDALEDIVMVDDVDPTMDAEPPVVEPVPADLATLFEQKCSGGFCHTGGQQSGGLALDAAVAAQNLVGVDSVIAPGTLRVKPQDPDNSLLMQKLGDSPPGSPMPLGLPALEAAEKQLIVDWINSLPEGPITPVEETADTTPDTGPDVNQPACEPKNDTYEVNYGDIVAIFQTSCGGGFCHTGGSSAGGMALDTDVFLSQTVGVKATASSLMRIAPGSAEDSYLYLKLTGEAQPQMPQGGPPLTDDQIDAIESWIDDCARDTAEKGVSTGK